MRICIVGSGALGHVGESFHHAAHAAGMDASLCDTRLARHGSRLWQSLSHRFRDRLPAGTAGFERAVLAHCRHTRPDLVLVTGTAPLRGEVVRQLRELGARTANFLTDDPWSPTIRSRWFLRALTQYDLLVTPRSANLAQLAAHGAAPVVRLPFAYDPRLSFPEDLATADRARLASDVLFVGGADPDRVPLIEALLTLPLPVALYGGYWSRFRTTRAHHRGFADPHEIRRATRAAKVVLCLTRRSNRDGHVMRSYEAGATGACLLVEYTDEHRELFGPEGATVTYFRSEAELAAKAAQLVSTDDATRERFASAVSSRVRGSANTYGDRLRDVLAHVGIA